ncbi:MAG: Flp family type IVb pilin [Thermoleophilia bacterium]|nr:Flp family type IVb pilin [Thermoleophilia bacterium]
MTKLYCYIASRMKSEEGAAMAEYGLLVALIAVVAMAALTPLGQNLFNKFQAVATAIGP